MLFGLARGREVLRAPRSNFVVPCDGDAQRMGRKKIRIERIAEERNRQVIFMRLAVAFVHFSWRGLPADPPYTGPRSPSLSAKPG